MADNEYKCIAHIFAKRIDSGQPALSAQADLSQYFLQWINISVYLGTLIRHNSVSC